LRRVETRRYNVGRPYGTRRKDCGYECLIGILISTVPSPLLSFSCFTDEAKKENGKKNATRDVKTSKDKI
jgi:hypothetical protein